MSNQKQVATPKDRIAEEKAIRIQQELYLLNEKPANDANARRRKKLQNQLDAFVSNIVGDNKPGSGRQSILDVIKQAALARNRKDRGDPPKKTVEPPMSPPDKSLKELYKERLDKGQEVLQVVDVTKEEYDQAQQELEKFINKIMQKIVQEGGGETINTDDTMKKNQTTMNEESNMEEID